MSAPRNLDDLFEVKTPQEWQDQKVLTTCSVARYVKSDFEQHPWMRGSRRMGQLKIVPKLHNAAKEDLDALRAQHRAHVAALTAACAAETAADKKQHLQNQIDNTTPPKLPFQVLGELVRRVFSKWNPTTLATFLRVKPGAELAAPKLHAYTVSALGADYDPKFTPAALGSLLQGWRRTMAMTRDTRFAVLDVLRKQQEEHRKAQQQKDDDAHREQVQKAAEKRQAAAPAAPAASAAEVIVPAAVGGAMNSVVAPVVSLAPVVPVAAAPVAPVAPTTAKTTKKRKKKPKKPKTKRTAVVLKRRKPAAVPAAVPAADVVSAEHTNPLMTI